MAKRKEYYPGRSRRESCAKRMDVTDQVSVCQDCSFGIASCAGSVNDYTGAIFINFSIERWGGSECSGRKFGGKIGND